jgi:hypothetical protein
MKTCLWQLPTSQGTGLSNPCWGQLLLALVLWSLFPVATLGQIKQWDKTIGGSSDDYLSSVQQTQDGGYILGGYSGSNRNNDKTEDSRGAYDYWVVKLDGAGNKQWDKTIGSNGPDWLTSLQQTQDGGYILGGYSAFDVSGDKTEASKGFYDYWVVKLDGAGNKQWDKTIGGSRFDYLSSVQQTQDGGYILGGYSDSFISGDKTEASKGYGDYWVVKLDTAGNKQWDKTIGGSGPDWLTSLQQTQDGGYILGGRSDSPINDDKTEASKGYYDYWVVKLDGAGNKQWDKTFGGSRFDYLSSVQQTQDGGYILGGYSDSFISGDKTEVTIGLDDYWMVKLDTAGNKQWDKTTGGSGWDRLYALQPTADGGYILGGYSDSDVSGDKTEASRGFYDYWVVKLASEIPAPQLLAFSPAKGLPGTLVTLTGQHLLTTRAVRFNGQEASFEVVSDSVVQATVPANATSGSIEVETAGGPAISSTPFTVLQPGIAAFLPVQGRVGARVYLVGNRLATAREVYFNGIKSPRVKVYLDWAISAIVPEGATTGPIKVVLQGGGSATSASDFIVLPEAAPVVATQNLAPEETPRRTNVAGKMAATQVLAYPNPFHQQVTFSFTLAQPQPVVVKVYDLLGREVSVLYQGEARGRQAYQLEWRPATQLPGGLYIIRLQTPGQASQHKVQLVR